MTEHKTLTAQILALAARPEGISSRCMPDMTGEDLSTRCCGMVRDGRLYRGGLGRGRIRYFTDESAAKAYTAKQQPTLPTRPLPKLNAGFAKDAKVVITSDTKVTICPGYKPRFEAIALLGGLSVQKGRVSAVEEAHARAHLSDEQEQGA